MELEQPILGNRAIPMSFDEVSTERSLGFVKALQELKNLRPQLYSAAEYCEKTYLHNEQKQMVLDNLKDYAVRALVNAVDHLGTVAYKLTELIEQQSEDVSNAELKISCLNQRVLTCRTYMDKEGLRQQQLLAVIPRHHKHYILPNSVNKKVHFSPHIQIDLRQHHYQARSLSGNAASRTLSWHLASEAKPTLKGSSHAGSVKEDEGISRKPTEVFHLTDNNDGMRQKSSAIHLQQSSRFPGSKDLLQTYGATHKELFGSTKQLTAFGSFDNPNHRGQTVRTPVRSKSVMSTFFVKQKTPKLKVG